MNKINLKDKNNIGTIEIKNQTDKSADLMIYGYISDTKWFDDDVVPNDVKSLLDEVKDVSELNIYVNSGGGSVFAGMAIYNMLNRFKANKTVYVDGLAGSIASVICFCGDKLVIPANSYLMIHKAWTLAIGNADEMLKMAERLEVIDNGILNVYETRIKDGISIDDIRNMVSEETWMTGDQASEYFDITVSEPLEAVAYSGSLNYRNTPEIFKKPKCEEVNPDKKDKEKAIALLELEREK